MQQRYEQSAVSATRLMATSSTIQSHGTKLVINDFGYNWVQ